VTEPSLEALLGVLAELHRYKDAAYGDAWRKRGEVIAIFANLARKYDRLAIAIEESAPARTEPLADTLGDLCVYAAKYLTWIAETEPEEFETARLGIGAETAAATRGPVAVEAIFELLAREAGPGPPLRDDAWRDLQTAFGVLEHGLMAQASVNAEDAALLSWPEKARVALQIDGGSAGLLWRLWSGDHSQLDGLCAEVERMRGG
jgi:hypothetical protein